MDNSDIDDCESDNSDRDDSKIYDSDGFKILCNRCSESCIKVKSNWIFSVEEEDFWFLLCIKGIHSKSFTLVEYYVSKCAFSIGSYI